MDHKVAADIITAVEMFVDDPDREYTIAKEVLLFTADPTESGGIKHNYVNLKPGHKITFVALWARMPGTPLHLVHKVKFRDGFVGYIASEMLPGCDYFVGTHT